MSAKIMAKRCRKKEGEAEEGGKSFTLSIKSKLR